MPVGGKSHSGSKHAADTRMHHPGNRRVGPPHCRARVGWLIGFSPGEFIADRSGVAPLPEGLTEHLPRLAAEESHKGGPVGGPAFVLDQRPGLAEGQVKATDPVAWFRQQLLKSSKAWQLTNRLQPVGWPSANCQLADGDGDWLAVRWRR